MAIDELSDLSKVNSSVNPTQKTEHYSASIFDYKAMANAPHRASPPVDTCNPSLGSLSRPSSYVRALPLATKHPSVVIFTLPPLP